LADKYADTYTDTISQLNTAENELADLLDELTGNEFDMAGLQAFQTLLKE